LETDGLGPRIGADLFRACLRWQPLRPCISRLDCFDCRLNYLEKVCPLFRRRFLSLLGEACALTPEQIERGIAALRADSRDP
jgi:hypothetical protein